MAHTGEVRAAWILVVTAGCFDGADLTADATIDAGPPSMRYRLGVSWHDTPTYPEPTRKPTVFIDGIATEQLETEYASAAVATGQVHLVELRYDALVLASRRLTLGGPGSCLDRVPDAFEVNESLCGYPHGELRYLAEDVSGPTAGCAGDGFCIPYCLPTTNGGCPGARCTSIYSSLQPVATHLGCAPAGTHALGEPCSLVMSSAGIHDNCGAQLLCVEGTCRSICNLQQSTCTSCSFVPGHAPEVAVCN